MLKRIINKIKYHLIKEIVLVDSENIGYQIPEEIPKHTLVYLFISDPYIDEKIKDYKNNKHIKDHAFNFTLVYYRLKNERPLNCFIEFKFCRKI